MNHRKQHILTLCLVQKQRIFPFFMLLTKSRSLFVGHRQTEKSTAYGCIAYLKLN